MERRLTERIPRSLYVAAVSLCPLALLYLAYKRPGYFTNQTYLGGLLLLEFLAVAVWMYRKAFFALVIMAFLLAGVDLPVGAFWTAARWAFLGIGALVGSLLMLKERRHHFGLFQMLATFAALSAIVSAAVSQYPRIALLKALSFALLFLYGGTGARLAVTGRENRFFTGLLTGCEVFVGAIAAFYAVGIEAMGNPNSLGAVMGVVGAPILLWGTLLDETPFVHRRRLVLYGVCMFLIFHSQARAAMAAAVVSSGLLCLALRKYRMLAKGAAIILVLVAVGGILRPDAVSDSVSSLTSSVLYKGTRDTSVLASRESPWRAAVDSINNHFWFGTGLGTADTLKDSNGRVGMFSSSADVTNENGSSYLTIVAGVGILGAIPFALLLLVLLSKIFRVVGRLRATGNACYPAVPLAMVMVAGLIHAGFEDWLFASGSYLCVWFWTLAFILVDVAPSSVPRGAFAWRFRPIPRGVGGVAPSR
jgi:O-antigen ligase